jgi:hypothetical protein
MSGDCYAIEWNGAALIGWVTIDGAPVKVSADRDMIHDKVAGFNDAVDWEIGRHRGEIFGKLRPILIEMELYRRLQSSPSCAPTESCGELAG